MLASEPASLAEWSRQRRALALVLQRLAELARSRDDQAAASALDSSVTRLLGGRLTLAILGEFKRGKSTLINALLDEEVVPVGVIPMTSAPLWVEYGQERQTLVEFHDVRLIEVGFRELLEYATETGNPGNQKGVVAVRIRYPAAILKSGVILIDTPGIGSVHAHNTKAAYEQLRHADAAVLVLSVDSPASQAELDFLAAAEPQVSRVVFCLNKADRLTVDELTQSAAFVRRALSAARGGTEPTLFPISARLRDAGFQQFKAALERFLVDDRGRFLIERARNVASLYLKREEQAVELQKAALQLTSEELERRVELLHRRMREVGRQRLEVVELLGGDLARLTSATVDPSVDRFRASGEQRLAEVVEAEINLRAGGLRRRLDKRLVEEIPKLVGGWIDELERELTPAIREVADRHAARTNQLIGEARELLGEVLGVALYELTLPDDLVSRSERLVLETSQQLALDVVSSALKRLAPGRLGVMLARRDALRQGAELVDRHCGRVRHDVAERLKTRGKKWSEELGAALVGLESSVMRAVEEAVAARADGEGAVASGVALLTTSQTELGRLRDVIQG
ncbi:MAG: dynamin family protein [Candidatus Dormibacteria bacterium]